ncbi:unnamed protein product [Hyaloperonospora brassicae]|uniref:Rieske domain-containing protein n=1 Tax=Hyaloperonospora brassicae TaxID=162125 RepID=A0AAV0TUA4_HYABA|nr:unnamed protein product [Hyaloperonospora brassicae]
MLTIVMRRHFSTGRRVLCSLQELQNLNGRGLKFPVQFPEQQSQLREAEPATTVQRARRRDALATGFVFWSQETQQPRAFLNRCPHALLELDWDDSDFFCEGFLFCKAHAAFFDPDTGVCLRGPTSSRKPLSNLNALHVAIDGEDIVLLTEAAQQGSDPSLATSAALSGPADLAAYKREKQRELANALSKRSEAASDVEAMQHQLHEKTMARLKRYEQIDDARAREKCV